MRQIGYLIDTNEVTVAIPRELYKVMIGVADAFIPNDQENQSPLAKANARTNIIGAIFRAFLGALQDHGKHETELPVFCVHITSSKDIIVRPNKEV